MSGWAFLPIRETSSSSVAEKIDFREGKCARSFFAVAGPIFGKPSKMN